MSTLNAVADSTTLLATFAVKDVMYAIEASRVQEVIRPRAMTRVPHAGGGVLGVINLRGRIVTIFDAGMLLGVGASDADRGSRVIIVHSRAEFVGLMVERVAEVLETESGASAPVPANLAPERAGICREVYRVNERVIALLDTEALLAPEVVGRGQRGIANEPARAGGG